MLRIVNEKDKLIDIKNVEATEQAFARTYIEPDDCVLELGARFGSVSCTINKILKNKTHQVVFEPDARVWDALEKNRDNNECFFHIVKGCLSKQPLSLTNLGKANGYATSTIVDLSSSIPFVSLDDLYKQYKIPTLNVLVADCEGCLQQVLSDFPEILDSLRLFIFEADSPTTCDYKVIRSLLQDKGFTKVKEGFQNVWKQTQSK